MIIAQYFGLGKKSDKPKSIEAASEFVPVTTCTEEEYADVMRKFGLPVPESTPIPKSEP